MSISPQNLINTSPMSKAQIFVIGICILLNMMDGFDILIMAFTASSVSQEWSLSNSTLGVLLSAGLFGMASGALFLAPYADRVGRRTIIIICTIIMGGGMILSGYADSYLQLAALRFLTGIGIGGMIASLNTIVSECSSDEKRGFAVSLLQTGNPIGSVLGGLVAVYLLGQYGWRATFIFGGVATLTLLPLVLTSLPESISFLEWRRPVGALEKINKILLRYGHSEIRSLADAPSNTKQSSGVRSLFSNGQGSSTLLLGLSFFTIMFSFYFVMSWTPQLLVQAGLSASDGISGAIILNIGGIIGAPILGYLSAKRKLQNLIGGYMFATAMLMVIFGMVTSNFIPALSVALFLGFFLFGSIVGLYALAPNVYSVYNRAAGIGFAIGVGRIGAVLAPIIAGVVLDRDLSVPVLFAIFAVPMIICMFIQKRIRTI